MWERSELGHESNSRRCRVSATGRTLLPPPQAFDQLPLCYVIGGGVCVVHGGLPKFDVSLDEIEALQRGPVPFPGRSRAELLFQALLWSDPKPRGAAWGAMPADPTGRAGKWGGSEPEFSRRTESVEAASREGERGTMCRLRRFLASRHFVLTLLALTSKSTWFRLSSLQ